MSRHHHHQNKHHHPASHSEGKGPLQKRWIFIVAVVLMLIAMGVYMLTLDESIVPEPDVSPVTSSSAP